MTEQSIGTARLDIVVDKSNAEASISALKRNVSDFGKTSDDTTKKTEQNSSRQVAALKRQADTLGFTREEMVRYRIQTQTTGKVQADLLSALDKSTARMKAQGVAFNQFGVSAKQQAAALRQVPSQITDIFTSLASGQRPLTVLIQQGGQLKDVFGGIVPAARALGGAVLGLVNPFTVAAAAAGGLFLAWKQGSDEAVRFRQALALTGDAAGVTADQMGAMSVALSQGAATQNQAAKALAEVARSGKFVGEQLEQVARTALAMEKATGQSVEQTVAAFAKLRDDPVRALEELNKTYHFLTLEVYEQVKALQAQGREEEAIALAIDASSRALTDRANEVVQNASYMEKAWRGLGAVVRQVWDDIRNAGRASTAMSDAQMKIASANSELQALAHRIRTFTENGGVYSPEREKRDRAEIERLKKVKAAAERVINDDPQAKAARDRASRQRANELAINLDQEAQTYLTTLERLQKKRTEAIGKSAEAERLAREAGNATLVKSIQEDGRKIVAALDKQIADAEKSQARSSGGGSPAPRRSSAGASASRRPAFQVDTDAAAQELLRLAEAEARATESFKDIEAQLQGPLAVAMREHEAQVARLHELAAKSPTAMAGLNDVLALEEQRHNESVAAIEAQLDPLGQLLDDMALELDLIGKSNAERAVMIELRRNNIDVMSEEGQAALATARAFEDEAEAKQRSIDLMDGFRQKAADALADITGDFDNAGEHVKDFFNSLADMVRQAIAEQWIKKLFGEQGSDGSGTSGGGWLAAAASIFGGSSSAGSIFDLFSGSWGFAKGGAFSGGNVMAFANGGVVGSPTLFPMRNGMGLMGEAGPEAIVPLHRGPDGKLGIRMERESPSRQVTVQQSIYVTGTVSPYAASQMQQEAARKQRIVTSRNG